MVKTSREAAPDGVAAGAEEGEIAATSGFRESTDDAAE
jgi:hypothetical protein